MNHIFQFEQQGQQSMEPRQELPQIPGSDSRSYTSLPTTTQLTRIFSASICSLTMAFFFLILSENTTTVMEPLFSLAAQVILAGAMLVLGVILFAGIPLAIVVWQSTPRSRFLLLIPFLATALPLLALIFLASGAMITSLVTLFADLLFTIVAWRSTPRPRIPLLLLIPFLAIALIQLALIFSMFLSSLVGPISFFLPMGGLLIILICGTPILSTIAINRAIKQAIIPDKWLRFAQLPSRLAVFAIIVMFLGLLSWGIYLAIFAPALFFALFSPLNAPWNSWLLILIGMLISVIVAAQALSPDQ